MREEDVTKAILKWLLLNGWEIVAFDFPQSGTGIFLHPDNEENEKNKNSINPDIVAVKEHICVFFENKDRFYSLDFVKIDELRNTSDYSGSIERLLKGYGEITEKYYGIGLPVKSYSARAKAMSGLVDFVVGVDENKEVSVLYNPDANKLNF